MLYIDDLLDAYDLALKRIDQVAGRVFNIGGGHENVISVWKEFGPILERQLGKTIPVSWGDWRPGDQRLYVSDIRKASLELGWQPKVGVEEGIQRLANWVLENRGLFQ